MDEQVSLPKCITNSNGTKYWYLNGKRHREDGPAYIDVDGSKEWWLNGELHREDGPAVIWPDGQKNWYLNGYLHREDGPAIIYANEAKFWCINGKYHREDGPAVIWPDGTKEWWLNGERIHHPFICSFIVDMNKVEQKMFASEHFTGKFMIEKLNEGIVAWMNK